MLHPIKRKVFVDLGNKIAKFGALAVRSVNGLIGGEQRLRASA
jgi:hypothetical protein